MYFLTRYSWWRYSNIRLKIWAGNLYWKKGKDYLRLGRFNNLMHVIDVLDIIIKRDAGLLRKLQWIRYFFLCWVELTRLNFLSNHFGQVFYSGWSKIRTLCHSNICMIWINFRVICPSAFSTKHFYIIQITTKLWQGWSFIKMFRWSWYIDDYIPAYVRMSLELQGGHLNSLIEDYRPYSWWKAIRIVHEILSYI